MPKIYKNDVGTKIRLDAGSDISSATELKIKYLKPDGTKAEWPATPEGTQFAYYITQEADLNVVGKYKVQLYVVLSAWKGHGEITDFSVFEPLKQTS